jgi:hypothetical protein
MMEYWRKNTMQGPFTYLSPEQAGLPSPFKGEIRRGMGI